MAGSDDQPLTPLLHFLIPWCTSTASPGPHALFYAVRTLLFLLPRGYFFCLTVVGIPCSPALERKIKTIVLPQQVDVPKFWGWRLTNNLFFTHIYFLFFDCQVKLIFHVIKCHSYKFVHVWLMPSIPPPGGLWSQKLGQTAVTNKETRLMIQEKRSPCLTIHSTNLSFLWRSLTILMVKLHHLSQIDFQRNICRT